MQQTTRKPLFPLGQVVATPGALAALEKAGQTPEEFLTRHRHGDWGELDEEDLEENRLGLEQGFRLLSSYRTHADDTTSMLNVLGRFIPSDERVLLIEDTSEIHMAQDNLVRFEARQPQNGLPAITIRELLKASLVTGPIVLSWAKSGEERPSTSCNFSTPAIREACQRSMPRPRSKVFLASQVVSCRAGWICPIAQLRPTWEIP